MARKKDPPKEEEKQKEKEVSKEEELEEGIVSKIKNIKLKIFLILNYFLG